MPSSRASSPLSSATPSPNSASTPLPPGTRTGSFSYQSDDDSDRDDRSRTSSTAARDHFSDESELTEDEDQPEQPIVPVKRDDVDSFDQPVDDEEGEDEGEEEDKVEEHGKAEDVDMDDAKTVVPISSGQRRRSRESSTSLSPPPSVPLKPTGLPAFGPQHNGQEDEAEDKDEADGIDDADADDADADDNDPAKPPGDEDSENDDDAASYEGPYGNEPFTMPSKLSPKAAMDAGTIDKESEAGNAADDNRADDQNGGNEGEQLEPAAVVEEPTEEVTDEQAEEEGDAEAADITVPQQPTRSYHSSHAPPPTAAHVRELLRLELKFAALRDQLYVERMEEVAAEEQMILDGTHPALQYLYKTLSERRERLHEVASRRHQETKAELKRARESDKNHTWSWWTDERDRLHWEEFESTWSKRRRLAREKNEIETPRIIKPIPRAGGKIRHFDWSAGAAPAKMSLDEASSDLAMMENRPPIPAHVTHMSRHASPVVYAPAVAVQQPVQQHGVPIAGPSNTNGIAITRPPAASSAQQQQSSFGYGGAGPLAYNIPRQTHAVQPVATAPAAAPTNRPPAQSRPQGRTVPTTSDLFDSGRKDAAAAAMPWAKTEHNRHANGHGHAVKDASMAASTVAQSKAEDRPPSRFPALSEYMNSTHSKAMPGSSVAGAGGYGGLLGAGSKMLSPPKTTPASVLGTFASRPGGPFTAPQSASPTPAGTTATRP